MKQMRKAARQKDEDWALNVFDRAPFVTMSMIRPDGTPYGLPLSLIRAHVLFPLRRRGGEDGLHKGQSHCQSECRQPMLPEI